MAREIVLDTETTGFDPKTGDRLIEVGCIEIEDLLPTGRTFHRFINPERLIPPDAIKVHGITDDKVKDAPKFHEVVDDLMEFLGDAPLIAHNANFDRNFIDFEIGRIGRKPPPQDRWIDTLALAQKRFPGMANSLDALCKRYKISLVERTLHGALIDARLLAEVYLELRGGKERALDLTSTRGGPAETAVRTAYGVRPRPLPSFVTAEEDAAHLAFLRATLKDFSLWAAYGVTVEAEAEEAA
ncbi:DNA polymerase III subunit epsilon [Brevundimonas diminuta]|uniref:DNA polymerase III subunit epsilon n=1 Tax=Brevundimonas diminuta TaxID=293 RepID=UPI0020973D99|nr:DNA polymerase III subunit epsilon [Brevundimonas diminuta]MCO8020029.1 DNA polymerase III subunit epsilon [Brevundimonas diminuta]MCO8022834.1 DNA polymerase III subunit epsilon [Brevundimonas diminuta]